MHTQLQPTRTQHELTRLSKHTHDCNTFARTHTHPSTISNNTNINQHCPSTDQPPTHYRPAPPDRIDYLGRSVACLIRPRYLIAMLVTILKTIPDSATSLPLRSDVPVATPQRTGRRSREFRHRLDWIRLDRWIVMDGI